MRSYRLKLGIIKMVNNHYKTRGFTLIEFVFTIILISIISVAINKILFQGYQTILTSNNISEADWQGFIGLERMVNDIHTIRSAADITTIGANQLVFTDVSGNSITFQLSGSNLMRNSQILASGIQSLSFAYSDAAGSTTATASLVRYISITMTMTQGTMTLSMSTLAGTRGMK